MRSVFRDSGGFRLADQTDGGGVRGRSTAFASGGGAPPPPQQPPAEDDPSTPEPIGEPPAPIPVPSDPGPPPMQVRSEVV